ncbi:Flp family type IVb pilin [Bradyrhizobium jicamae]|uniref:Flp family type IVb pilin n=1 Tax=Bradyrhizobium jicamae TaxID=280332 RepID=UPI001BA8C684|nr:Flp family type IVb pilin [Bradyrhizobium jicamae]MBR0938079.1 Flp family type IVb pilin [Bradyrhizobium jicamae]
MKTLLDRFLKNEAGIVELATAIEYGLIGALIALAVMVGATQLGTALNSKFASVASTVNGRTASTVATLNSPATPAQR